MWEFNEVEMRMLISGNFSFRKCLDCSGDGFVWEDHDTGISSTSPTLVFDDGRYSRGLCDSCSGLGGFLKLGATDAYR